ncbi:YitT family protein, partial [Vibrio alfacsensis]
ILVASFFFVSPSVIMISILGAVMLNLVLAMNHKPTRYVVTYG